MTKISNQIKEFDFTTKNQEGIFICAGGFEDRSKSFISRVRQSRFKFEQALLMQYKSQLEDNTPNFQYLKDALHNFLERDPEIISVHSDFPVTSFEAIKDCVSRSATKISKKSALIDISGMTHLWAIAAIHSCLCMGLQTRVTFTEARWYYPLKRDFSSIISAWKNLDFDTSSKYLQSKALKSIHIAPEFGGNFRPGHQTCLIIFVGYEPNRIEGLVDKYAPGRLIVLYGKSPHKELSWRTTLSKNLHKDLFSNWYVREAEISTLSVDAGIEKLEKEFDVIKEQFDVAIAPQCSKMQALASYLFWKRHPEVQLIFTTPVSFNPNRYSRGSRRTFIYAVH